MASTGAMWKQIPLFQSLTEAQGAAIEKKLQPVRKEPGVVLFTYGQKEQTMYFLLSGSVVFTYPHSLSVEGKFEEVGAGAFFGEVACFSDEGTRTATATVTQPLVACTLARAALIAFLKEHPDAALTLLGGMAKRMRRAGEDMASKPVLLANLATAPPKTLTQKLAKYAAEFAGSKAFFALHGAIIAAWIAANTLGGRFAFDPYPFNLLGLVITTEALLFASVVLMNQTREAEAVDENNQKQISLIDTTHDKVENLYRIVAELETQLRRALPERKPDEHVNPSHP